MSDSKPDPRSTHEGEIANELRHIYNILSGFGDSQKKNQRAKERLESLTQDLEETAWGETKPMDDVPAAGGSDE